MVTLALHKNLIWPHTADIMPRSMKIEKCLGERGLEWLMELFNVIFKIAKMFNEWTTSTSIPIYKNKGDI